MIEHDTVVRSEHVGPVGTRISWGAIFAGCMTALGMYFLLATLGAAVGLSISARTDPSTLQTGAIVWAFLTTTAALFVGGVVTSLFTTGEDRIEAVLHGVIMWAVLFTMLLVLGTAGIESGFNAMASMASAAPHRADPAWEKAAQDAGVPAEQIEAWRSRRSSAAKVEQDAANQQIVKDNAKRFTWYAFIGTWISMIAGALGGLAGAGPTFRVYSTISPSSQRVVVN